MRRVNQYIAWRGHPWQHEERRGRALERGGAIFNFLLLPWGINGHFIPSLTSQQSLWGNDFKGPIYMSFLNFWQGSSPSQRWHFLRQLNPQFSAIALWCQQRHVILNMTDRYSKKHTLFLESHFCYIWPIPFHANHTEVKVLWTFFGINLSWDLTGRRSPRILKIYIGPKVNYAQKTISILNR